MAEWQEQTTEEGSASEWLAKLQEADRLFEDSNMDAGNDILAELSSEWPNLKRSEWTTSKDTVKEAIGHLPVDFPGHILRGWDVIHAFYSHYDLEYAIATNGIYIKVDDWRVVESGDYLQRVGDALRTINSDSGYEGEGVFFLWSD